MKYNAALAITDAIIGSSREKNYQELGLESLQQWYPTNTPLGFHIETTWKYRNSYKTSRQYRWL